MEKMQFAADGVIITTLVENYYDALTLDTPGVKRRHIVPAMKHSNLHKQLICDGGFSMLIDILYPGQNYRILFDAGANPEVLMNNMKTLDIDPVSIDHCVISHAHPDHVGGLVEVAKARGGIPLPVLVHPDAFLPRYICTPFGWIVPAFTIFFNQKECEEAGAYFVKCTDPFPVAPATITTGEIPWSEKVPFEPPGTPHPITIRQIKDGKFNVDKTADDSGLIINLKGKGLVVITGCAHSGVINTILRAQEVTGVKEIYAVLGGFHLGFPESPDENIPKTIEALKQFNPTIVCPMHCSGFKFAAAASQAMPKEFVLSMTGTQFTLPIPG